MSSKRCAPSDTTVPAQLIVRPFESPADFYGMIDYFRGAPPDLLERMGVDPSKLPSRAHWFDQAWRDHSLPVDDPRRDRVYLAWLVDGQLVGHSSANKIQWGDSAYAHLHLWRSDLRAAGIGSEFFRRSIEYYFKHLELRVIYVEPSATNAAPNRVLEKLGFTLARRYRTVPGPMNFEQEVNRYEIRREAAVLLRMRIEP